LLYYPGRGFEVTTPLGEWYERYQRGSPFAARNWEAFVDPRETTYAKYTEQARAREAYVDSILQSIEDGDYDRALPGDWRKKLDSMLGPLRFPLHGFQMIAAYVGQMAPSGRIAVAAAFQAGDEIRRIQRIAYRMAQLRLVDASFGAGARDAWQREAAWQPLRETVERCLVTYDWGEAFVALNLCVKPAIDELFMVHAPKLARRHDDFLLGQIFASLGEDCRWHKEWTVALCDAVIRENPTNRTVIDGWVKKWSGPALRSAGALAEFAGDDAMTAVAASLSDLLSRVGVEVAR
jgi:toluene monooxygenase system protein E